MSDLGKEISNQLRRALGITVKEEEDLEPNEAFGKTLRNAIRIRRIKPIPYREGDDMNKIIRKAAGRDE